MQRPPARCAPFTCTSACCSGSSSTIGSGSVASLRPSARKPRSTAAIATAKGILSRNASSRTTRISIGEDALQTPLGLGERFPKVVQLIAEAEADVVRQPEVIARHEQHAVLCPHLLYQVESADRLAVAHEPDGARLRGVPAERVAEALQPLLDHRVVGAQDPASTREHLLPHPRLEYHSGEMVAGARWPDRGVVVPRPRIPRESRGCHDPADPQARQPVRLRAAVHHDHALVAAPERRRRGPVALRALVDLVREQPRTDFRRATDDGLSHLLREQLSRWFVRIVYNHYLGSPR